MKEKTHLHILWTNDNPITAEKMVFMYGINGILQEWWEKVTIIVWGAPAKLVSENPEIQMKIQEAIDTGVKITACKACTDQLNVTKHLEKMNIEVKYWGKPLTDLLKNGDPLLTV